MARVAFQGDHGAYSELAIAMLWPGDECVPYRENADVVRAVEAGEVDRGVLPIENSIAGTVTATVDALLSATAVHVVGEAIVPIHHCLLGVPGASVADIQSVESHPVALAQCRTFFARHPGLTPRAVYDTAGAAHEVAWARDPTRAALAGAPVAARYGLSIIERDVEDRPDNRTRFVGISRTQSPGAPGSRRKTSLAVESDDIAGALRPLLAPSCDAGARITWIETRPNGRPWSYTVIVDVVHDHDDPQLRAAIEALTATSRSCRVLGTYAVASESR